MRTRLRSRLVAPRRLTLVLASAALALSTSLAPAVPAGAASSKSASAPNAKTATGFVRNQGHHLSSLASVMELRGPAVRHMAPRKLNYQQHAAGGGAPRKLKVTPAHPQLNSGTRATAASVEVGTGPDAAGGTPVGVPFTAITQSEAGFIPPDPTMAAGPMQIVVAANGRIKAFNKNGSLVPNSSKSVFSFFSSLGQPANDGPFDPKLAYDQAIGRFWFISASEHDSTTADPNNRSNLLVAVSDSSDVTAGWTVFALDASNNAGDSSSNWCDYPQLGFDAQAVYFTCNMFSFPSTTGSFQYAKIRVILKSEFLNNACCGFTDVFDLRYGPFNLVKSFTVQPAHMYGAAASDGEFLVNAETFCILCTAHTLQVWQITDVPNCCNGGTLTVHSSERDVGGYPDPTGGRQSGSTTRIDTGDVRLLYAFWKNGHLSTGQDMSDGSGNSDVSYTELDVSGGLGSISTVQDWQYGASGADYYYPAVDINAAGNMTMAVSRSGPSEFVSGRSVGLPASSSCHNCNTGETTLASGQSTYVQFDCTPGSANCNPRNRWGDYLGASADPDGTGIWVHSEFAGASNSWGTVVGLSYESQDVTPPTTTATLVPAANGAGWNNTGVTVNLNAIDDTSVQSLTYSASGAQSVAPTTVNTASASFSLSNEGLTTVSFAATDTWGNVEAQNTITVRIDKTAPVMSASATSNGSSYTPGTWATHDVTVTFACTDALSGVASYTAPRTVNTDGANQFVTGTCTDVAGNTTSLSYGPIDLEKSPPTTTPSYATLPFVANLGTLTITSAVVSPAAALGAPTCFNSSGLAVTLTATDSVSGVKSLGYTLTNSLNGTVTGSGSVTSAGTPSLSTSFNLTSSGATVVTFTSTNVAGVTQGPTSIVVFVNAGSSSTAWSCAAYSPTSPPGHGTLTVSGVKTVSGHNFPYGPMVMPF